MGIKDKLDLAQRRSRPTGVALATLKKFREDNSSNMASTIAFWAFFSLFPLLMVFVTLLGYLLPASEKSTVLRTVAELFPLVSVNTVKTLSGTWWPLAVGGASALWSGLAVVRSTHYAFDSVWEVRETDRTGLVGQAWRSVLALLIVGSGLVLATLISGLATGSQSGVQMTWYYRLAGYAVSLALDVSLFMVVFRLLTTRKVSFREVRAGALLAGISFFVLQQVSALIISRYLSKAQGTYGNFAVVITMLWWFYLQAQIMLLGAQLNVVLTERLHPRSLFGGPQTEADRRALAAYAQQQTFHPQENVDVEVDAHTAERARDATAERASEVKRAA